ncbi:hypothetical protein CLU79DRAFT_839254 [Phycomyces nitens]|nr:hypothetical protein CLU79DRAFT_839254 [Phycomyces nitens]
MPVTDLPFEILSKIASKLDYATVMQCCLVCKAFVDPFQELLWRDIRISSQEQLDIICNPDISEGYEKFGKLVHNLCLITRTLMTNKHLQYIQNIFPNVTKLYIHGINSGPFDCLEPSTLIPWSSVKNLDITLLGTSASAIKQDYMALLPLFPNTVDLKLNCRFEKGVTLYVEDFEIIHSSLPNLKYLLTSARLGTMTVRDMFRIPELLPAKTLEHLIGGLEDIDHRWMCYFAQKYPNLQVAKWVIDEEYDSDEEIYSEMDLIPQQVSDAYGESIVRLHDMYHSIGEDGYYHRLNRGAIYNKEEALHMFSQLSLVFPRLKTIEIYSTGETDIAGSLIQKIFGNFQVPIKHIHYFFGRNLDETGLLYKTISGFTLAFSQTIEELFLDSMISFSSLEKIAMAFESCPHLRRLEISKCNVSVDIEILMERCVSLEQIKIEGGLVGMSTDVERSQGCSLDTKSAYFYLQILPNAKLYGSGEYTDIWSD